METRNNMTYTQEEQNTLNEIKQITEDHEMYMIEHNRKSKILDQERETQLSKEIEKLTELTNTYLVKIPYLSTSRHNSEYTLTDDQKLRLKKVKNLQKTLSTLSNQVDDYELHRVGDHE